jgi:ankyrin repeat protein
MLTRQLVDLHEIRLLDCGVPGARDPDPREEGLAEMAMALLDKGADVQAKNSDGVTPLHLAYYNGHAEVAKALLEKSRPRLKEKKKGRPRLKNKKR